MNCIEYNSYELLRSIMQKKKIVCVIPARLQSTRFPGKMLAYIGHRPLLEWVWQAAIRVPIFDEVLFAVDNQLIGDLVDSFGARYVVTSESCANGTERLIEIMQRGIVQADIWVNWQGDEPFISKHMIDELLQSCHALDADIWTLKKQITDPTELMATNIAKIVCDKDGYTLLCTRSMVPFFRDENDLQKIVLNKVHYKHIGLYAFTTHALSKIASGVECPFEEAEKLEGLKFLYNGLRMKAYDTLYEVFGVDTPSDLARAEIVAQSLQESADQTVL